MRFLMGFLQIGGRGNALRGMGYAPAVRAGERAPLGLRGLGEDFDFSP